MITNINNDNTMYILFRKEIKDFDVNVLKPEDAIVIEHHQGKKSDSDYFISMRNYKAKITTRYDIRALPEFKLPYYMQDFITDIQLALNDLKRITA